MPVVFTFDLSDATPIQHNRVQSFLERLGWENIGGSAYRYPKLGTTDQPVEDWFNHVVPALMLFRAFVLKSGIPLPRFTLDVQSSSGRSIGTKFGERPRPGKGPRRVKLYPTRQAAFGERNLREWLDNIDYPY